MLPSDFDPGGLRINSLPLTLVSKYPIARLSPLRVSGRNSRHYGTYLNNAFKELQASREPVQTEGRVPSREIERQKYGRARIGL